MRLEVRDLSFAFGSRVILERQTLRAASGQVHAVMGPSGAGKSTLLALIHGELRPQHGVVLFDGHPRRPEPAAWVVQSSPMLDRRTAVDNAALGALAQGRDLDGSLLDARANLAVLGLGGLADRQVFRLSGGERQRVAVARAMTANAPLILADEPTASLDATAREGIVAAFRRAAAQGAVVIIATHDHVVAEHCDEVHHLEPPPAVGP